jgi:hypothetical protein
MTIEELLEFSVNIEEAEINPGKDSEVNACSINETMSEATISRKQGGEKGKGNQKRSGGKSSILKDKNRPSCDFCGKQGHTESACSIKAKAVASAKK